MDCFFRLAVSCLESNKASYPNFSIVFAPEEADTTAVGLALHLHHTLGPDAVALATSSNDSDFAVLSLMFHGMLRGYFPILFYHSISVVKKDARVKAAVFDAFAFNQSHPDYLKHPEDIAFFAALWVATTTVRHYCPT